MEGDVERKARARICEEGGVWRDCVEGNILAPMVTVHLHTAPIITFMNGNCRSSPIHGYTIFICIRWPFLTLLLAAKLL